MGIERGPGIQWGRKQTVLAATAIAALVAVNLVLVTRMSRPWPDEAMYIDPGVNLYLGHGFVTSTYVGQPADRFFAGTPFYQVLVFAWLKVLGFSLTAVRSLDVVLVILSGVLVLATCIRAKLVTHWSSLLLLAMLLFSSHSLMLNLGSGRPDAVGVALLAAQFAFAFHPRRWLKIGGSFVVGFLAVFTGLQLAFFAFWCLVLLLVLFGRQILKTIVIPNFLGLGTGAVSLYLLLNWKGVWEIYVAKVALNSYQSRITGLGRGWGLKQYFGGLVDPGVILVILSAVILSVMLYRRNRLKRGNPLLAGLAVGVLVPLLMGKVAVFPYYYSYLALLPVAIGFCVELDQQWEVVQSEPRWQWRSLILPLIFAGLLGAPLSWFFAVVHWNTRAYQPVEEFVRQSVRPDDIVYSEAVAYYAVRPFVKTAYFGEYIHYMSVPDKRTVNVLIGPPKDAKEDAHVIGGQWRQTAEYRGPTNWATESIKHGTYGPGYHLVVYERVDANRTRPARTP